MTPCAYDGCLWQSSWGKFAALDLDNCGRFHPISHRLELNSLYDRITTLTEVSDYALCPRNQSLD